MLITIKASKEKVSNTEARKKIIIGNEKLSKGLSLGKDKKLLLIFYKHFFKSFSPTPKNYLTIAKWFI